MKIIFSRKGFDSKFGGVASPVFESGKMLSLPIPDETNLSVRYCDLTWETTNVGRLVEDLTKCRISRNHGVHHDPDLRFDATARPFGWLPIFGQAKAAQSHLKNQGVGEGDLFLFFGWFKNVFQKNGSWFYLPESNLNAHLLFGWLQIGKSYDLTSDNPPDWTKSHPHRYAEYPNNHLYIAKPQLELNGANTGLPGGGVFPCYHPKLCLTAPNRSRSIWKLPKWFYPEDGKPNLSYHGNIRRWDKEGAFTILDSAKIGQEFVLDCKDYPEAINWLTFIFENKP